MPPVNPPNMTGKYSPKHVEKVILKFSEVTPTRSFFSTGRRADGRTSVSNIAWSDAAVKRRSPGVCGYTRMDRGGGVQVRRGRGKMWPPSVFHCRGAEATSALHPIHV